MKKTILALALGSILILSSCGDKNVKNTNTNASETDTKVSAENPSKEAKKYDIEFYDTFDTVVDIAIYSDDEDFANENLEYAKKRYEELHKLFDNYKNYPEVTNIKSINDKAGIEAVKVDDTLFTLIKNSMDDYYNISHKTNIALGPVTKLWNEYRDLYEGGKTKEEVIAIKGKALPSDEELEALRPFTNMDRVKLNESDKSIYIDKGMSLDLGATAKGFATELVAKELEDKGVNSAVISAGGNVRVIGKPKDGRENFKIGIQNPDMENEKGIIAAVDVAGTSIVTSGDYQRYFDIDGLRYCHIIDPDTLKPAMGMKSVTVIKEDSGLCDFLSTAAFNSTDDEIKALGEKTGSAIIWMDKDMNMKANEDASKLIDEQE